MSVEIENAIEENKNTLETNEYLYRLRGEIAGLRVAFMLITGLHRSTEEVRAFIRTLEKAEELLKDEVDSKGIGLISDRLQDESTLTELDNLIKTLTLSVEQRESENG